jgi:hypothetical protein
LGVQGMKAEIIGLFSGKASVMMWKSNGAPAGTGVVIFPGEIG